MHIAIFVVAWLVFTLLRATRKTSILNKLIYKPQAIHGGQRVCEENNELELELEKKHEILKYFAVKGPDLKGCRRTVTLLIGVILTTRILYSIKVIVQ